MKNLILICFLLLGVMGVQAQANVTAMTGSGDTITNTTADSVVYPVTYYYQTVSIHAIFKRISGTAAGKAELFGTIDGTNYQQIGTDTLAMAASGNSSYIWIVNGSPYRKYKVVFTGSTTLTGSVFGYMLPQQSSAKGVFTQFTSNGATVTNSGSGVVNLTVNGYYSTLSIQVKGTKTSGTIAGTVTLQGSNDGTNFVTVNTSYLQSGTATLSCTDIATNSKIFVIVGAPYKYYRLSWTGSGTMAGKLYGYAFAQK
jgi:hypothetical protein